MKKLLIILSLFIFTSCAALNSAKGELHLEINITKGQELLDLKKALDAGAITTTEFELMKQRVIDDYYMKKAKIWDTSNNHYGSISFLYSFSI